MVLKSQKINYFTCILCFLLLIIILLSRNLINQDMQFFFLIIIVLLIIISCLLENSYLSKLFNRETFQNINLQDKSRNCYEKNKEHRGYQEKIDTRLDDWRNVEEKNRKSLKCDAEKIKNKELEVMNEDYLVNGESF